VAAIFYRAGQGIAGFVGAGRLRVVRNRDRFIGSIGYAPKTQVGQGSDSEVACKALA
jgi:hypothetical protein